MELAFYAAAAVAILATARVITNTNPVHALLSLIVSLLAVAMIFLTLGAPFAAALEVIVYAGAILVLFVFVVMMLNLGSAVIVQEKAWLQPRAWALPAVLTALLLGLMAMVFVHPEGARIGQTAVGPKAVGVALFGPYLLAVELTSMLLLAALVAAYHLGKRDEKE